MQKSFSESYKAAGVDVVAGYKAVELMKEHVAATKIPGVMSSLGGFGGLFMPDLSGISEPVLVSGTDGVGTKLKIAFALDKHDTVGIDCVAMCVNDIVCSGARPLFFLDYIAVGKNVPERVATVVSGVAQGCIQAGCALIGGETAEMPGFYPQDEYDLAGFAVGLADKGKMLDPARVKPGDAIISLASSGVHSNGFSLVRRIIGDNREALMEYVSELGCTIGEALLAPTKIYVKPLLKLMESVNVHAVSHITGGGFFENIPRALPGSVTAKIELSALDIPALFQYIGKKGNIPQRDMFNTFNMGTGMCVFVDGNQADEAVRILQNAGEDAKIIGHTVSGDGSVELV